MIDELFKSFSEQTIVLKVFSALPPSSARTAGQVLPESTSAVNWHWYVLSRMRTRKYHRRCAHDKNWPTGPRGYGDMVSDKWQGIGVGIPFRALPQGGERVWDKVEY